jgi:hypothetical protein
MAAKDLGKFVVAGKAEVETGHASHRSPAAVVAHHHQDGDFVPYGQVANAMIEARGAILSGCWGIGKAGVFATLFWGP